MVVLVSEVENGDGEEEEIMGVIVTFSIALSDKPPVSVTFNLKNIVALVDTSGAVNVALFVLALSSTTAGLPEICVHANVKGSPSGSWVALPSNVTSEPGLTTRFGIIWLELNDGDPLVDSVSGSDNKD